MPDPGERPLTFTEEARHRQIIDCTVALMAERGYTGTTLSRIAQRAGISKAAVLYHFASKDKVIEATLMHVYTSLATIVGGRVERAGEPVAMLVAYLRGLIEYLRDNPAHVRVIVEILGQDREGPRERTAASPDANSRWQALATILAAGQETGQLRPFDTRVMALAIGGAIDGIVAHWLADPDLDLDAAADELETIVLLATRAI
ncbi:MAG: TetR/AcrR family transcriptional regulator [Actinomycetota bacterium]|nr:TetR/AcrR family transcriptional regulator [Actinomycetota bacterium]